MTLWQIICLCAEHIGEWTAAHPVKTAGTVVLIVVGSSITAERLELPIWRWPRDWINRRLDGLGKRLNASLTATVEEQGAKIVTLETAVGQLLAAQAAAEATADRRRADDHRQEILRFNLALVEGSRPDRESYVEILLRIDRYTRYCEAHPDYQNSRADAAITNIKIHYNNRLKAGF